ncbi:hypothetical protein Trydic_g6314 [Trypoxylus dichotomus]
MKASCPCEEEASIAKQAGSGELDREGEDPFSNPANLILGSYEQIKKARKELEGIILKTPLVKSKLSELVGINIYIKLENEQPTGSFKERGARYAIMNMPEDKKHNGVYTGSSGNHALSIAYHGKLLGVPVTVVMPTIAPLTKIEKCELLGATVITYGLTVFEAKTHAIKLAKEKNGYYINGCDHPHVLSGAGTVGIEVLEQLPTANAVVIPVGGGGLIAGMAVAIKTLKPCTKIIGVESENCKSFNNSLKAGKPVFTEVLSTIADGLASPFPGYNAVATARDLVDRMLVVKEDDIAVSILRLVEYEKLVIEGAGAAALAPVLSGQLNDFKGKNVVLILTGGNIDTTVLGRVLERGLAADGRLVKLYVTITDKAGSVGELTKLIASIGVSVKSIHLERTWILTDVFSMVIKVVCETKDFDHALQLETLVKNHYNEVAMVHADFPASTSVKP